jgi:hypothetical protein
LERRHGQSTERHFIEDIEGRSQPASRIDESRLRLWSQGANWNQGNRPHEG